MIILADYSNISRVYRSVKSLGNAHHTNVSIFEFTIGTRQNVVVYYSNTLDKV